MIEGQRVVFQSFAGEELAPTDPALFVHDLSSGETSRLVDTTTVVPGQPGGKTFTDIDSTINIDRGELLFIGAFDDSGDTAWGIYTIPVSGGSARRVIDETQNPELDLKDSEPNIDDGNVFFCNTGDAICWFVIDGVLTKVLELGVTEVPGQPGVLLTGGDSDVSITGSTGYFEGSFAGGTGAYGLTASMASSRCSARTALRR